MLDSEFSVSFIADVVVNKFREVRPKPAEQLLLTASGKRMHSLGEVDLEIEIGNLRNVHKFIVASPLITYCILGTDYLARHRINLDFGNRVATGPTIGRINSSDNLDLDHLRVASSCPIHGELLLHPEPYLQISSTNQVDARDWECLGTVHRYDQSSIIDFPDTNKELIDIIGQFQELFSSVPGVAAVDPFQIRTGEITPVKVPPRMIPQAYHRK